VRLADYIAIHLRPAAFLDFGCSSGLYLHEVKKRMPYVAAQGFEFSEEAIRFALCPDIVQCDLTKPLELVRKPDTLGLCLEVLEHIDDAHWSTVLQNIARYCDRLIFSAAVPGQGGTGHINCRPKIDWIRRFHTVGWVVDVDATRHMQEVMRNGYHMGWFAWNAMVLVPALEGNNGF
jgi:hypothetical protein